MRQHYSFYDLATGLFTGSGFTGSEESLMLNLKEGVGAMPGEFDQFSQAVEPMTGRIVNYQPPSPGEDYEWNETTKRWVLGRTAQLAFDNDVAARARLADIDSASIRALREAAIGDKAAAVAMLTDLEAEAVELRADVLPVIETEAKLV